jgi:hypothetical protein
MQEIGRVLVGLGVLLVIVGVFLWKFAGHIPLGHLPGDIAIQKPNFSFYFPFTTCLILSIVVSLVLWLLRR